MKLLDRNLRIEAIVSFVINHPESTASLAIRRAAAVDDRGAGNGEPGGLRDRLEAMDEETLAGYYCLVK